MALIISEILIVRNASARPSRPVSCSQSVITRSDSRRSCATTFGALWCGASGNSFPLTGKLGAGMRMLR
jgi:hypothetical protein